MIDESEICRDYRQSKDKSAQISILAELYATTPASIRDILEHNGFIVESLEANSTGGTRARKRWTSEMVEEAAKLWAGGATLDELAQQYQTTIAAILGLQNRNKKVFAHYLAQPVPELHPTVPAEVAAVVQEELAELPQPEKPPMNSIPIPIATGARLSSVGLLISHARALQQAAHDALSNGKDVDCAYALGELSQVLIRAKETITAQT